MGTLQKRNADIISPNGGENAAAVEMLGPLIRNLTDKGKYDVTSLLI